LAATSPEIVYYIAMKENLQMPPRDNARLNVPVEHLEIIQQENV